MSGPYGIADKFRCIVVSKLRIISTYSAVFPSSSAAVWLSLAGLEKPRFLKKLFTFFRFFRF